MTHIRTFSSNNHSLSQAKQTFSRAQYIIWSFGCSEVSRYVVEGFSLPKPQWPVFFYFSSVVDFIRVFLISGPVCVLGSNNKASWSEFKAKVSSGRLKYFSTDLEASQTTSAFVCIKCGTKCLLMVKVCAKSRQLGGQCHGDCWVENL